MKQLVNVRLALFVFISLVCGILSAYFLLYGKVLFAVLSLTFCIGGAVFFAIKRKKCAFIFLLMLICVLLGFGLMRHEFDEYDYDYREDVCVLSGRVTDIGRNTDDNTYVLYLDDCHTANANGASGKKLDGLVRVRYYLADDFDTGDKVDFYGTLSRHYVFADGVDTWSVRYNVRYEFDVDDCLVYTYGELKLDEKCRKYVFDTFREKMPAGTSGLAYALITGDRSNVSDDVTDAFRSAGVMHLLAVSGLHVGFVVWILSIFIDRFKINDLLKLCLLIVPLLFYGYVCAFSASVIRAIIMTCCVYLVRYLHGCHDLLSALSLAGVIILLIEPLYLFDVGFILSFLSVFGIATFTSAFQRLYKKRIDDPIAKYLLDSISVSLGATLATSAVVGTVYGSIPLLSVFFNLVAIPLVTVAFIFLVFGLVPYVHFLTVVSGYVLRYVAISAKWIASLSFATFSVGNLTLNAVCMVVLLLIIGGFINLKGKVKRTAYVVLLALVVTTFLGGAIPQKSQDQVTVAYSFDKHPCMVATSLSGDGTVVCDFESEYSVSLAVKSLKNKRIKSCEVIITDFTLTDLEAIQVFAEQMHIDHVYILSLGKNLVVQSYLEGINVWYEWVPYNYYCGETIKCRSLYDDVFYGYVLYVGNIRIGTVLVKDGPFLDNFNSVGGNVSAIVSLNVSDSLMQHVTCPVFSSIQSRYQGNFGANKYGNFTITQNNGKIVISV